MNDGKLIKLGEVEWRILGEDPPVQFCDIFTEINVVNGVVYLSLCSAVHEFNTPHTAVQQVRLRLPVAVAQNIVGVINNIVASLAPPSDPSQVN